MRLRAEIACGDGGVRIPSVAVRAQIHLRIGLSHVAGRFAALAARYGIAVHFDAALRQRRRRRHELRSLVQQNAIHVKTIVALVLPFEDRHFMFDVRQIGGDCHVDRMARSVVLLSGRFHAAWIAVFHADAVMRAVDGHARLTPNG